MKYKVTVQGVDFMYDDVYDALAFAEMALNSVDPRYDEIIVTIINKNEEKEND